VFEFVRYGDDDDDISQQKAMYSWTVVKLDALRLLLSCWSLGMVSTSVTGWELFS
jgi:hypothetical protein